MNLQNLKVAIVADWLTSRGGAENVVKIFTDIFPNSPIYTTIFDKSKFPEFKNKKIITSFLQHIPFSKKHHSWFIDFMPTIFENFDFSKYDIVLSSSHSVSKGILTSPYTMHICYCHTPPRYLWDESNEYIKKSRFPWILKKFYIPNKLKKLRIWDQASSSRVDYFISNSNYIKHKIQKYYHVESEIIFPPVELDKFEFNNQKKDYFLYIGRIVNQKKVDFLVDVFNELELPLKIVGEGPYKSKLAKRAKPNIEFRGFVSDEERKNLYKYAKAVLFPQTEDFGIVPLEAMASGTPVIAYKKGGILDTLLEDQTGIFFDEYSISNFKKALDKLDNFIIDKGIFLNHIKKFSVDNFKNNIQNFIINKYQLWQKK